MKKITTLLTAGLLTVISASAIACPKGTTLVGGTGPNHKGGSCVAVNPAAQAAQKAKADVLALGGKVRGQVVVQPPQHRRQQQQRNDLNGHRAIACVIDKHAQPKAGFRRRSCRRHCKSPYPTACQAFA